MMVNYHRRKTEEKALLDLCLQCIYIVLFPGDQFQSGLTKTLFEIQRHVTDSNHHNATALVRRIEQIKLEIAENQYQSIGENAMLRVHEIIASLNFPEAPLIASIQQHGSASSL